MKAADPSPSSVIYIYYESHKNFTCFINFMKPIYELFRGIQIPGLKVLLKLSSRPFPSVYPPRESDLLSWYSL